MSEAIKKIERDFVLSDSSLNVYGFRLLTSGYQIDEYKKNPIGYLMHDRDDGVMCRWEDLRIEGDKVLGKPVINMSNERGAQTVAEIENDFLNAASVGHIVVLEYSMDPKDMVAGQTGPTITKWYNKECSLVDIPGNECAYKLYDTEDKEIKLADLTTNKLNFQKSDMSEVKLSLEQIQSLGLAAGATSADVLNMISNLKAENTTLKADKQTLSAKNTELQTKLDEQEEQATKDKVKNLLDKAQEEKKLSNELRGQFEKDYAKNPEGLEVVLKAMPKYESVVKNLGGGAKAEPEQDWKWDDYQTKDPSGKKLENLKATNKEAFDALFEEKFGKKPN